MNPEVRFGLSQELMSTGTKPSISGCGTVTSPTGGAWAGTFTAQATSCAAVLTLGFTANTGWTCFDYAIIAKWAGHEGARHLRDVEVVFDHRGPLFRPCLTGTRGTSSRRYTRTLRNGGGIGSWNDGLIGGGAPMAFAAACPRRAPGVSSWFICAPENQKHDHL
jgi:hypothetical protein